MKKTYEKPMMIGETFVADEYVSACYYIKCAYSGQTINVNGYNQKHSPTGCGDLKNQAISVKSGDIQSENGATISITELDAYVLGRPVGDLPCYFVPREHAQEPRSTTISNVKAGETIYWVTNVGYWMSHKGEVTYEDDNRPNHS